MKDRFKSFKKKFQKGLGEKWE